MADSALKEAIRIVLETEGREGVDALRKSLESVGDVSVDLLRRIQRAPKSQLAKCLAGLPDLRQHHAR